MSDFDGWLTSAEVAAYLRCHKKTAEKLMRSEEIKAVKFGQTFRTKREWCDAYMERLVS